MEGALSPTHENRDVLQSQLNQMAQTAGTMSAWLRFLGIISVLSGALSALTIVGLVFAWLPIWLGVLLFQAGDRASRANLTKDPAALIQLLDKLKLYFILSAAAIIVALAFAFTAAFFAGAILTRMTDYLPMFDQIP